MTAQLEVRVPRTAKVWVKTSTAPVSVSGVVGDVELYTVTGEVRVAGRPATLRVESLAGPLTLADGADWLRARTSSGDVAVRGAVGDAVLATVGGTLSLDGAVTQRARLETVTGAVRQRGPVARDATLAIDTNSGDVTLRPDGAALDLLTLNGRVTSARPAVRGAVRAQGRGQAARVDAGTGRVEVRSFKEDRRRVESDRSDQNGSDRSDSKKRYRPAVAGFFATAGAGVVKSSPGFVNRFDSHAYWRSCSDR
jgi:DUF4097 and DUF4098 domain-containing protein YvlB